MSSENYRGLAFLVVLSFTSALVLYLLARAWEFVVDRLFGTRPNPLYRKVTTSVSLAWPIFFLLVFVQIAFRQFQKWWFESPYVVSALALFFFGAVPIVLGRAIVRVWRPRPNYKRC